MSSLTCLSVLKGPDVGLCLSLSNSLLAAGFENGSIYLSPNDKLSSPVVLSPSSEPCTALAFANSDPDVLYSSYDGNIVCWDLRNYKSPVNTWKVSEDEINSIDFNASKGLLAVADDLGHVSLVSTSSGKVNRVIKNHENICSAALFRPSWQGQLISTGLDCRLVVSNWEANGRKPNIFEMSSLVDPLRYAALAVVNSNGGGGCGGKKRNKPKKTETLGSIRVSSLLLTSIFVSCIIILEPWLFTKGQVNRWSIYILPLIITINSGDVSLGRIVSPSSSGSADGIDLCAERRHSYQSSYDPQPWM